VRFLYSKYTSPNGVNWGWYDNPKVDALIDQAHNTFDPAAQDALMAQLHEIMVDEAQLLWVVHDVNPHALSPKIKQFIQAQSWFQDLTTIGE
jgi:peptide/nickel transport system substrate-binding protein